MSSPQFISQFILNVPNLLEKLIGHLLIISSITYIYVLIFERYIKCIAGFHLMQTVFQFKIPFSPNANTKSVYLNTRKNYQSAMQPNYMKINTHHFKVVQNKIKFGKRYKDF